MGIDSLNSRESHSFGLLGHLTGMDVVRVTSFHVRVLLSYISPALPSLFTAMGDHISAGIQNEFPQSEQWTPMKLHKSVVHCISEGIALILFGADMTQDNPELIHLAHDHTNNGKQPRIKVSMISFTILTSSVVHASLQSLLRHALCTAGFATHTRMASPGKMEADQQLEKASRLCCPQGSSKKRGTL